MKEFSNNVKGRANLNFQDKGRVKGKPLGLTISNILKRKVIA